jgi:AraC family transcriptional activator of pobA
LSTFVSDRNPEFRIKLIYKLNKIPIKNIASISEPGLLGSLSIRTLEEILKGKDMVQSLHRHDFFYLLVVEKGYGQHEIDFNLYQFMEHDLFLMRPGQVHKLQLNSKSRGFLMQFTTDFYNPQDKASLLLLRKAGNKNHYRFDGNTFAKLKDILQLIQLESTTKKEGYNIVVKSNLDILLVELIRDQNQPTTIKNLHLQEKFDKFSLLLEQNILKYKKVSEYATILNLSVYQLNSITKSAVGKTCSEVIDEQVVLEAKRCILATSNQISQMAYRLGYEDVSYFIRFFKKHTGHTPEAYRQNFR